MRWGTVALSEGDNKSNSSGQVPLKFVLRNYFNGGEIDCEVGNILTTIDQLQLQPNKPRCLQ